MSEDNVGDKAKEEKKNPRKRIGRSDVAIGEEEGKGGDGERDGGREGGAASGGEEKDD